MIAPRISVIVLATTVIAVSTIAMPAGAVELENVQITSYQLGVLDMPAPPKFASPQPGGQATGYNTWRANFGRTSASPSATNGPALRHGPAPKR